MLRHLLVILTIAFSGAFLPEPLLAQSKTLKLGDEFKDKLERKAGVNKYIGYIENNPFKTYADLYVSEISIKLKEGQDITITATVKGTDRLVGMQFLDPTRRVIGNEKIFLSTRTSKYTNEEVPVDGDYTIIVVSEGSGSFTLLATSDAMEDDREMLERELKELKKRVAEIEAKLKALEKKSIGDKPKK